MEQQPGETASATAPRPGSPASTGSPTASATSSTPTGRRSAARHCHRDRRQAAAGGGRRRRHNHSGTSRSTIWVGATTNPDPALLHVSRPPTAPATAVEQRAAARRHPLHTGQGVHGTETFQYDYCLVVPNAAAPPARRRDRDRDRGEADPVPVDDPDVTTQRDQPVVVEVMKNDRDPDPARLQVGPPGRPGAKTEEQPDGTVRYTLSRASPAPTPSPTTTATGRGRHDRSGACRRPRSP